MRHEAFWITQDLRKASSPRGGTPGARVELAAGRPPRAGVGDLSLPMAAGLTAWGRRGFGPQASARAAAQVTSVTTAAVGGALGERRQGLWLRQRAVDPEANCRRDPGGIRRALSPLPCVENLTPPGLELSGARASSPPVRRAGDCPLAALQVAGDKKKSDAWEPISPSWKRAAFCSCLRVAGHGRRQGTHPSSHTTTSRIGSRLWLPLLCRRSISIWACSSASSRRTSRPSTSLTSCGRSSAIYEGPSSCCGSKVLSIGGRRSRQYAKPIPGCMWKSSRRMRRSSTPRSRSGTTSKATPPTACCGTRGISTVACGQTPAGCGGPKRNCAHSSAVPSCHLHREKIFIAYAKLNKGDYATGIDYRIAPPPHAEGFAVFLTAKT
jgi:hypothetical protein